MPSSRRRRTLLLWGAAITILVTVLWSAYQFTVIWLSVRCARELAQQANAPPEFKLPVVWDADTILLESGGDVLTQAVAAVQETPTAERIVDRLESLQRPKLLTIWRELSGSSEEWIDSSTLVVKPKPAPSPVFRGPLSPGYFEPDLNLSTQTRGFAVKSTAGELIWMVVKKPNAESRDEAGSSDPGKHRPDVLMIDAGGRIFGRFACPEDYFLGKLAEPFGKADGLIFSSAEIHWHRGRVNELIMSTGTSRVCVIENGQLKTVQKFWLRSLPSDVVQAPTLRRETPIQ